MLKSLKNYNSNPYFCFIIITLNEEKHIKDCLESISKQVYDKERMEIILVDTGSSDGTLDAIRDFQRRAQIKIKLFRMDPKNSSMDFVRSYARNFGVKQCKHTNCFLIFLDAHVILPSCTWLRKLAQYVETWNIISGPVIPPPELGPILRYFSPREIKDFLLNFLVANRKENNIFYGGNSCFNKILFEEAGLFPPVKRSEDILLLKNALKIGGSLSSLDELYVYHIDEKFLNFGLWLKRMFYEGFYSGNIKSTRNSKKSYSKILISIITFSFVFISLFITSVGGWIFKLLNFIYKLEGKKVEFNLRMILILLFLGIVQAFVINIGKIFKIYNELFRN